MATVPRAKVPAPVAPLEMEWSTDDEQLNFELSSKGEDDFTLVLRVNAEDGEDEHEGVEIANDIDGLTEIIDMLTEIRDDIKTHARGEVVVIPPDPDKEEEEEETDDEDDEEEEEEEEEGA